MDSWREEAFGSGEDTLRGPTGKSRRSSSNQVITKSWKRATVLGFWPQYIRVIREMRRRNPGLRMGQSMEERSVLVMKAFKTDVETELPRLSQT